MPYRSAFHMIVERTLRHEGGYAHDPLDPGGETMYGITRRSHPEAWRDGPPSRSEAIDIYRREYYEPLKLDTFPDHELAYQVFDAAVNQGPEDAAYFLQQALNDRGFGVVEDGVIGPETLEAVWLTQPADSMAHSVAYQRMEDYRDLAQTPRFRKFFRGWINRL